VSEVSSQYMAREPTKTVPGLEVARRQARQLAGKPSAEACSASPRTHARIFCLIVITRWSGTETCTQRLATLVDNLLDGWSQLNLKNLATVFVARSYGGLVVEKAIVQVRQPFPWSKL